MRQTLKFVIDTLKSDPTIQSYVASRVTPHGVDISPEILPCITVLTVSETSKTIPPTEREGIVQVDIWSKQSQLQTEEIYEQIVSVLNFAQYQSGYGTSLLRWSREDMMTDLYEADRRIWHKAVRWKWWAKP